MLSASIMKILSSISLGCCVLIASTSHLWAETVASNLSEPSSGYTTGFGQGSRAATAFTTADDPAILDEASLVLSAQTTTPAEFSLDVRTDNAGVPGVVVGTFTNQPTTSSRSSELLTFDGSILLSAQTTYWLTVETVSGSAFWPSVAASNSTGLWTIGGLNFSEDNGNTWLSGSASIANLLSLDATIVPEPSAWVPLFVGSGVLGVCELRRRRARA